MKRMWMVMAALLMTAATMAQTPAQPTTERMTPAMRLDRQCQALVEALSLTTEEAARFVPTFKQYKADMDAIFKENFRARSHRSFHPQSGSSAQPQQQPPLSDEQIEAMILNRFKMSRAILDVREKYYKQFRSFMRPQQIQRMYELEKRNAERMSEEHMRRRPDSPQGRPIKSLR